MMHVSLDLVEKDVMELMRLNKKLRFGVLNDKQDLIFNFNLGGKVQDSFANQNSRISFGFTTAVALGITSVLM